MTVADLEVVGVFREFWCGEFDWGDEFVGVEVGIELRSGAGEAVEVADGDGAFASGASDMDGGVECGKGDVHVARVGGYALAACSKDGVVAVEALDGSAAAAWSALVACGKGGVHEVVAASALQEVAAGGGHVAELRGGSTS